MSAPVSDLLRDAIPRLRDRGVPTPRMDAELLLAHTLGVRRLDLHAHPERIPTEEEWTRWRESLQRRLEREPVPYITERAEFFGLLFRVGRGVLIPRPETEILVEAVLARVPENALILDVGTGSGCIAIALAHRLPAARLVALDPSPAALDLARANAEALGLSDRVRWVEGWFPEDAVPGNAGVSMLLADSREPPQPPNNGGSLGATDPNSPHYWGVGYLREAEVLAAFLPAFDAIAANPPYIPSAEIDGLEPELRVYEPRLALDGGSDGLRIIHPLLDQGADWLRPRGILAMEIAAGQSEAVLALAAADPRWRDVTVLPDLAGIPRVLVARKGE